MWLLSTSYVVAPMRPSKETLKIRLNGSDPR